MFSNPSEMSPACPRCGAAIAEGLAGRDRYDCPHCRAEYGVLRDGEGRPRGLVEAQVPPRVEPLHLPTGSVRALISLSMVGTCWGLLVQGRELPGALMSLVLTIVGFYFGFRTRASTLGDHVYDPSARREQPLHLPAGAIRTVLVLALLAMGYWLVSKGLLGREGYLEFLVILAGLIVGHYFGKAMSAERTPRWHAAIAHIKGLVGLAVAFALAGLLLSGMDAEAHPAVVTVLAATISFYFGSRSS